MNNQIPSDSCPSPEGCNRGTDPSRTELPAHGSTQSVEDMARDSQICVCGEEKTKGALVCWDCFKRREDVTPLKYFGRPYGEWLQTLPQLVQIERGDGQVATPAYQSASYEEFCQREKDKGLRRDLWHTLPQMWGEELKFRTEFEDTLEKFSEPDAWLAAARAVDEALREGIGSRWMYMDYNEYASFDEYPENVKRALVEAARGVVRAVNSQSDGPP